MMNNVFGVCGLCFGLFLFFHLGVCHGRATTPAVDRLLQLAKEKQNYRLLSDWYKCLAEARTDQLKAEGLPPFNAKPHPYIQDIIDREMNLPEECPK